MLDIPRLFGEVFSLLELSSDLHCRFCLDKKGKPVGFEFGCEMLADAESFFDESDIHTLWGLVSETSLDSDEWEIFVEDRQFYPIGTVKQVGYFGYGYSNFALLTSRTALSNLSLEVHALINQSAFEERLARFLIYGLSSVDKMLDCRHAFRSHSEAFFGSRCKKCLQSFYNPEKVVELRKRFS